MRIHGKERTGCPVEASVLKHLPSRDGRVSCSSLGQREQRVQRPSGGKHAWHVPEDKKLFSQRTAGVFFTLCYPGGSGALEIPPS